MARHRRGPAGLPFQETYGFDETFGPDGDDLLDRIQTLVNQPQTDGVLTVPGHRLELWQVADEGFLHTLDPPDGPRLCSRHLGVADLMPDMTAGSVAAFAVLDAVARVANQLLDERDDALRTRPPASRRAAGVTGVPLGPPTDAVVTPTSSAGPDTPATPRLRAAGAFPQPGAAAADAPPPAPGPAAGTGPSARRR